jgi:DNA adenine methylase
MTNSFFRYPGGKTKLKSQIISWINAIIDNNDLEYYEPFFGGGSIGLKVLEDNPSIKKIWINDKDLGISSLWTTVINNPDLLKSLVINFTPSIEKFDEFKNILIKEHTELKTEQEIAKYGFMKLAIHQISYSGLGTMSGGPLGGRKKENVAGRGSTNEIKYPIDCRWSPKYICKKIDHLHKKLSSFSIKYNKCTNFDFADIINSKEKAMIYLDPPYFIKGNDLYHHGFTLEDHIRLANILKDINHQWILSYDDCPEIRELYNWADIQNINNVNYSITALKNKETGKRLARKKEELLIFPKNCIVEEEVIIEGSLMGKKTKIMKSIKRKFNVSTKKDYTTTYY